MAGARSAGLRHSPRTVTSDSNAPRAPASPPSRHALSPARTRAPRPAGRCAFGRLSPVAGRERRTGERVERSATPSHRRPARSRRAGAAAGLVSAHDRVESRQHALGRDAQRLARARAAGHRPAHRRGHPDRASGRRVPGTRLLAGRAHPLCLGGQSGRRLSLCMARRTRDAHRFAGARAQAARQERNALPSRPRAEPRRKDALRGREPRRLAGRGGPRARRRGAATPNRALSGVCGRGHEGSRVRLGVGRQYDLHFPSRLLEPARGRDATHCGTPSVGDAAQPRPVATLRRLGEHRPRDGR